MPTGGLIENLSPSLSLASLNEVAMYSAYLATVVCEREEVQYQTWNIFVYKLTVLTDWRFLHRRNNPSNKKIWHSREKWGKSDHKNLRPIRPQRLIVSVLWEILNILKFVYSSPLISENNDWRISPNFFGPHGFCSIFAKKVGGSKNDPEKIQDKSWDRN